MVGYRNKNNPGINNQKDGIGETEIEALLKEFARTADLPLKDVVAHVMEDAPIANKRKAEILGAAVNEQYGGMDILKSVCASMKPS